MCNTGCAKKLITKVWPKTRPGPARPGPLALNAARPGLKRGPAAHTVLRNTKATSHTTSKRRLLPGRGTIMQIVPRRFCHISTKNERSVAFKIRQNPFSARAPPGLRWGELTTLPQAP